MSRCIKCGAELLDTDKFCMECGTPVEKKPMDYANITSSSNVEINSQKSSIPINNSLSTNVIPGINPHKSI